MHTLILKPSSYLHFFLFSQSWTFPDVLLGAMKCPRSS